MDLVKPGTVKKEQETVNQNLLFFNFPIHLNTMNKTAIFYSPRGGNVNRVADQLGEMIGEDKVDIIPVKEATKEDFHNYNKFILIGSTVGADHWDNEIIVNEWPDFFDKMKGTSFEKKKVAIVGLGNCVLYPEHFADGMAVLYEQIRNQNADILGFVNAKDYDFTDSEALDDNGMFCGLPIDEDNEPYLTTERLERWISALKTDFEF
jgi:flavodoxin I